MVTADHGMVPNKRTVDASVTKAVVRQAGGQYLFHTGGTAADIYLRNYWHARAVSEQMLAVPGVAAASYRIQPHGQAEYLPATGLQIESGLEAAYRYRLSTFVGPTSPDLVAPFRENTIGTDAKSAHDDHDGLDWGAQAVPLILASPGVRSGAVSHFPARLTYVAPTMLRLLDICLPSMDGIALADVMLAPLAEDVAAQSTLAPTLAAYQEALIVQSLENIQEDQGLGIHPPPSASASP